MENGNTQFVEGTDAQDELKKRLDTTTTEIKPDEVTDQEPVTQVQEVAQEATQEATEDVQKDSETVVEEESVQEETPVVVEADGATEGDGEGAVTDGSDAGTFTVAVEEHETLKANFEALETEVSELRTYKRNRELGDLKAKFSQQVSEQELTQILEANSSAPIEKLEVEIFALIGKKNYSLDNKTNQNKVTVVSPKIANEEVSNPYGDIFK